MALKVISDAPAGQEACNAAGAYQVLGTASKSPTVATPKRVLSQRKVAYLLGGLLFGAAPLLRVRAVRAVPVLPLLIMCGIFFVGVAVKYSSKPVQ